MTFDAIMTDLKAGNYKPVYFLTGDEPFYIDRITGYVTDHVLTEAEKSFNQIILYGHDTDMRHIIATARRYPMMAPRQVVMVKEAQQLKDLEGLESYLGAPMTTTMLVVAYKYKKLDKRTKLARLLAEKSVILESDRLWEDKIPAWISGYLEEKGCQADVKSTSLLVDFLGNDLTKIANELDKLILVLPAGSKQITADLIEKNIGISKDYNNFELTRALVKGDVLRANRIIRYFGDNQKNNPLILTLSSFLYYFTRVLHYHGLTDKNRENAARELGIRPFLVEEYRQASQRFPLPKTKQIISWLREYDIKAKGGSNATEGDLLKELVYKILH